MKRNSILTVTFASLIGLILILSCKTRVENDTSESIDSQAISDSLLANQENLVFYSFPSSQEMFSFIKRDADLVYRTHLVNPTSNISKYIDSRSKTLALGIYLADLSYMTLFNKTSSAHDYIDIITTLSSDLRIKLPFIEEFSERIKNNLNNEDSLIYISDQYSTKIIDYLLQNNKEKILSNITSASYIEGLYLALNLVESYSENNAVIQRIVEQKHSFTNLIKYTNKYKTDVNTQTSLELLNMIYDVFKKFPETEEGESIIERRDDNKMILKGGTKIVITEENFYELKEKVTEVRTKIIENNL